MTIELEGRVITKPTLLVDPEHLSPKVLPSDLEKSTATLVSTVLPPSISSVELVPGRPDIVRIAEHVAIQAGSDRLTRTPAFEDGYHMGPQINDDPQMQALGIRWKPEGHVVRRSSGPGQVGIELRMRRRNFRVT